MKAVVFKKYGTCREALSLSEVELPPLGAKQVLVRVKAASINALDYRRFQNLSVIGKFFETTIFRNIGMIPGADISGVVHAVGKEVTRFKPGDEVFGFTGTTRGGFAEYAGAEENTLHRKPNHISFEEAAALPVAGSVALQAINKCQPIKAGMEILINGASGGVGSFVLQIIKQYETHVTAICSARHIEKARNNGADEIIDYTKTDFTQQAKKYNIIIAVNGYHSVFNYKHALKKEGTYIAIGGDIKQIMQAIFLGPLLSYFSKKKMMFLGISKGKRNDLETLCSMIETGKIVPPVDKTFPLSQTVDAFEYVLNNHARGKVVITI